MLDQEKVFSAEGIGKNIEQAIDNALFELKASREDVDIKIIKEGGFFKNAKVLVTISEDAREKYQDRLKKEDIEEKQEAIQEEKLVKQELKKEKKEEKELEKAEKKQEKALEKELKEENSDEEEQEGMDPVEFLKGLFEKAGKEVEVSVTEDENYRTYSVEGENIGEMIGHRGDCFYAINTLLGAVAGKQDKKILLDIGGYRKKREQVLTALAKRTAEKVAKTGRYARLDPMNPSDRRIIHNALGDDPRVVTLSKGEDPKRYVMVFPKDE